MRHLFTLLVVLVVSEPALAGRRARQCRQACATEIQACIETGTRPRACRRAAVRRCKRFGPNVCAVLPPTSSTTLRPTTSTTTLPPEVCGDGLRQGSEECDDGNRVNGDGCEANCLRTRTGLYGLLGTWEFTYSIISTFVDRYRLDRVERDPSGVPYVAAFDVFDGVTDAILARPMDLGFPSFPYEFALLDAGALVCDFFVFDRTGESVVTGGYFLVGTDASGACAYVLNDAPYPMSGVRLAAPAAAQALGDLPTSAGPLLDELADLLAR